MAEFRLTVEQFSALHQLIATGGGDAHAVNTAYQRLVSTPPSLAEQMNAAAEEHEMRKQLDLERKWREQAERERDYLSTVAESLRTENSRLADENARLSEVIDSINRALTGTGDDS